MVKCGQCEYWTLVGKRTKTDVLMGRCDPGAEGVVKNTAAGYTCLLSKAKEPVDDIEKE